MSAIRCIASLDTASLPFHVSRPATLLSVNDVTLRSPAAWAFSAVLVKLYADEENLPTLRTGERSVVALPVFVSGKTVRIKLATSQVCYLRVSNDQRLSGQRLPALGQDNLLPRPARSRRALDGLSPKSLHVD